MAKKDRPDHRDDRLAWSVPEVARFLGLSPAATYLRVKDGSIPSIRLGKRVVVPKRAFEELLGGVRRVKGRKMFNLKKQEGTE